ncbi:hypothetical protein [Flavobacterium sp.]|jgi:hypothetical protein|uniref:hypothetical protein n=1 Tax=Flavobacterium sp. TaxID=239 RepID=UPI003BC4D104
MTFNKSNFHKHTFCIFQEVALDVLKDLKLHYKSKSGSSYYFVEDGVYRQSNHWGRAANCKWRLISDNNKNRTKIGYANWSDFYPDNDFEKLYFIEVDFTNKSAHFNHFQSEKYSNVAILRTATETAKLLKQIRTLLEETAWTKHLKEESIAVLRKEIIDQLITTNRSFQEIKRDYL